MITRNNRTLRKIFKHFKNDEEMINIKCKKKESEDGAPKRSPHKATFGGPPYCS